MSELVWKPTKVQELALKSTASEILFGGARGGGKTDAGLQWLLYDSEYPSYRALVVRRNATDLEDWLDRAKRKYIPLGCKISGQPSKITFPNGGIIYTGHLKDKDAYTKYQGWELQKILIEEATHIPLEESYMMLLGSNRSSTTKIRPQAFLTTNPDGPGHYWIKKRFRIDEHESGKKFTAEGGKTRIYIPSTIKDNPYLQKTDPDYIKYLEGLKGNLKKQWLEGSWEDFEIEGSYYENIINEITENGQITKIMPEQALSTYTSWDLGISDSTAIWIFQVLGNEIRVIDFYENSGQGLSHYIKYLLDFQEKYKVIYRGHYAPHDIAVRELTNGKSRLETAQRMGINFEVAPNISVSEGIEAVRNILPRCFFDKERCEKGIMALKNYKREYDEKRLTFKDKPRHDWTSHAADSFRMFALSYEHERPRNIKRLYTGGRVLNWLGA